MSDAEPLKERIDDLLREAPDEDASTETIRRLVAREEGVRPSKEDVREMTRELVGEDRVEVVTSTGEGRNYRLVDTDYRAVTGAVAPADPESRITDFERRTSELDRRRADGRATSGEDAKP